MNKKTLEKTLYIIAHENIKPDYNLVTFNAWVIRKIDGNMYFQGYRETVTFIHCWWDFKMVQPLWKTV